MKICKTLLGSISIALTAILLVLYFTTKADPTSAIALATYFSENVKAESLDATVTAAWAIALLGTVAGGILSVLHAGNRKMELVMIICYAVAFLASLMYSLLIPCLLWISILDFICLMFSVSYSQIDNDFNGTI